MNPTTFGILIPVIIAVAIILVIVLCMEMVILPN